MFTAMCEFIEVVHNICLEMIGFLSSTANVCKYVYFQVIQGSIS